MIDLAYHDWSIHRCEDCVDADGRKYDIEEEREFARVAYRRALRGAQAAYPELLSSFSDDSWNQIIWWTVRLEAMGSSIPAAVVAAQRNEFQLEQAAASVGAQMRAKHAAVGAEVG